MDLALDAIEQAARDFVKENNITGLFEETINVNGYDITVRGNVVGGEFHLGTAFIP